MNVAYSQGLRLLRYFNSIITLTVNSSTAWCSERKRSVYFVTFLFTTNRNKEKHAHTYTHFYMYNCQHHMTRAAHGVFVSALSTYRLVDCLKFTHPQIPNTPYTWNDDVTSLSKIRDLDMNRMREVAQRTSRLSCALPIVTMWYIIQISILTFNSLHSTLLTLKIAKIL